MDLDGSGDVVVGVGVGGGSGGDGGGGGGLPSHVGVGGFGVRVREFRNEIRRTAAVTAGGGSGPLLALELSAVMDGDGLTVAMGRSGSGVGWQK